MERAPERDGARPGARPGAARPPLGDPEVLREALRVEEGLQEGRVRRGEGAEEAALQHHRHARPALVLADTAWR